MLETIVVRRDVQERSSKAAQVFREEMARKGVLVVNLVASPGAGKTTLLEAAARFWAGRVPVAVLVGDLETDRDAQRLGRLVPTVQLTTGGACHLELPLVLRGLEALRDHACQILFIENVGNLVCPAAHDLGEHLRVVLLSTTEGDDKPGKYPKIFYHSHAMVITKTDLLPYLPFSVESAVEDARRVNPALRVFATSGVTGEGVEEWCQYLLQQRSELLGL